MNLEDDKHTLQKLFMHPSFLESNVMNVTVQYISSDSQARLTHQTALTGIYGVNVGSKNAYNSNISFKKQ